MKLHDPRMLSRVFFAVLISCSVTLAQSQNQYDKGTPPQLVAGVSSLGSYMSTEFGTINLSNGGLNFNIPLGTVGGRGNVALPLTLSYSSKVWSASMDVDLERENLTEQSVAYADYDMGASLGGGPIVPGWKLSTGYYLTRTLVMIKRIPSGLCTGGYTYGLAKLTLHLPDGGEVEFRDDATDGAPVTLTCPPNQPQQPTVSRGTRWHATDGSGTIFINSVDNGVALYPTPNLSGTLIFADGTRLGVNGAIATDRNGNQILPNGSGGYLDQLGREIKVQSNVADPDNPNVTLPLLVTVPGYHGTPRYYKIKFGVMSSNYRSGINPTLPVINGDWDPEGWGYSWGTATRLFAKSHGAFAQRIDDRDVLTEVVLPDGRSLKFKYNEYGEVAEVELPTGGKIQYDYAYRTGLPSGNSPIWETQTSGNGAGIATDVKQVDRAVVAKRTYADGTNLEGTFAFSPATQTISSVTYACMDVTAYTSASVLLSSQRHFFKEAGRYTEPYNSQSQHDGTHYTLWSTGVEWRTEMRDGAGNVLAANEKDTTQRAAVSWSTYPQEQPANDNRVNESRRYLETGMMAKVETSYDQYNNPIEVKEYDYNQALKRRTVTTYLNSNNGSNYQTDDSIHLLRLPETQIVYDGSNNQVAKKITEYDVYTVDGDRALMTSYGSVSNHDSNYGTGKTTRGNPTRIGVWLNTTNSYIYTYPRYDILGNVVSTKDARGNITTFSFADDYGLGTAPGTPSQNPSTATYARPTLITSPAPVPGASPHTARSQYDYSTGLLTGFKDRNNVITQTIYNDPFNRPTLVKAAYGVSGKESHSATYYAKPSATPVHGITLNKNDVLTVTDQTSLDDANLRSWTVTDGFGRTKESWARDPEGDVKVVTVYDALSRVKQVSNPYRPSLGETAIYTTSVYDLLGRVTSVTAPDTSVVTTTYSANTVTVADQVSRKRKSVTDALGRLTDVYEDPDTLNYQTSYSYDTLDNLTTVTQGNQPPRNFNYNSLKQLTSASNPESGTTNYQYDPAGNLIVKTDARTDPNNASIKVSAHYEYDAFNRLIRRWYNGSDSTAQTNHNSPALPSFVGATEQANFYYDGRLPVGAPSFTAGATNGRLSSVTYGSSSSTTGDYLGYDSVGHNILKIQRTGTVNYQISAAYNLAGAPTSVTYPSGNVVNYAYNTVGRTTSFTGNLGDGGTAKNYATEATYSPLGGMTKEKFGTTTPVYNKAFYNSRGQLAEIRVSSTSGTDTSWNRGAIINHYSNNCWGMCGGSNSTTAMTDNNGNLQKQEIYIPNNDAVTSYHMKWQQHSYDQLNRLQWSREVLDGGTEQWRQTFVYDRYGNRTIDPAQSSGGVNEKEFTVDTNTNRLGVPNGQTGVMQYDAAGNLTNDTYTGAGNRTYDAENKIVSAWGGNNQAQLYTYDGSGNRIKRTVDGVETWQVHGLGNELLAEYAANGAANGPQKEYGYRNGQLLVTATPRINVAATANGGMAIASETHSAPYAASGAINGDRKLYTNNAWVSSSTTFPQWLQVAFNGSKTISEIDVFSIQNNYTSPSEPTETMTFSSYGVTAFEAQYWNGSSWVTVPGGAITGNDKVWKRIRFSAITTNKIRILISGTSDSYSRLAEVEAWADGGSANARVEWLVADQLGTPRMILDESGDLVNVKRHDYLPFGEELTTGISGRSTTQGYGAGDQVRQQFTQKERDVETGLDYFGARYYSSSQGRFTSIDPANYQAQLNPLEPQSWNAYSYVNNSPLVNIDPNGRGMPKFFEKLKNLIAWNMWATNEEVQKEEDLQRQYLLKNADANGAVIIQSPVSGEWQRVYPQSMNRANVFLWSDAAHYWENNGGGFRQLTPTEMAGVIDASGALGPLYRGGNNFNVRPNIDVNIKDGLVQTNKGVSLNMDPSKVEKFGGAYRVESIPDQLKIIQRGVNPGHFEIVPKSPMPLEKYIELLKQVVLKAE
jgi:RHS repeat-associated protein